MSETGLNTDRELYREDTGDSAGSYYENSLHVTADGAIGMNVGGTVIVRSITDWHAAALREAGPAPDATEGGGCGHPNHGNPDHNCSAFSACGDPLCCYPAPRQTTEGLCSQCGEMPSVMVKIGTSDGWCVNCLDEAAETKADARLAAVEALADELLSRGRKTDRGLTYLTGFRDAEEHAAAEIRAVLHSDQSEATP